MFSLRMFIWSFGRRMWSYIVLTCDRSSARNIIVLCVFSYNYDNYDKRIARTFVMSFMSQNWGTRFFPAQPAHARWAGNKQNNPLHTSYRWVWLGYVHPKRLHKLICTQTQHFDWSHGKQLCWQKIRSLRLFFSNVYIAKEQIIYIVDWITHSKSLYNWYPSGVWSEWCPDGIRNDENTNRQEDKKRVKYCDVRAVLHFCDVWIRNRTGANFDLCGLQCNQKL